MNDIVIDDCQSIRLRAERQGSGNGRVYTITVRVTDEHDNTGTADFQAIVPHSEESGAFDDGAAYSVAGCGYEGGIIDHGLTNHLRPPGAGEVSIYPNPVTDMMTVKWPENWIPEGSRLQIRLVNQVGDVMIEINNQPIYFNGLEIDVTGLQRGIYLLTVPLGRRQLIYRVVKL